MAGLGQILGGLSTALSNADRGSRGEELLDPVGDAIRANTAAQDKQRKQEREDAKFQIELEKSERERAKAVMEARTSLIGKSPEEIQTITQGLGGILEDVSDLMNMSEAEQTRLRPLAEDMFAGISDTAAQFVDSQAGTLSRQIEYFGENRDTVLSISDSGVFGSLRRKLTTKFQDKGGQKVNSIDLEAMDLTRPERGALLRNQERFAQTFEIEPPVTDKLSAKQQDREALIELLMKDKLSPEEEARKGLLLEERASSSQVITVTPEGTTIGPPGSAESASAERDRLDTEAALADSSLEIASIGSLLNRVNAAKEITGVRGAAADFFGGLAGQIPGAGPELEKTIVSVLTGGATPEEVTAFQTQAKTVSAQLIEVVTGEEGARISEMEQRVTRLVTKALNKGASKPQIQAALGELLELKIMVNEMRRSDLTGNPTYDLRDRDSLIRLKRRVTRLGLDIDQFEDLVKRLDIFYGEQRVGENG